MAIKKTKGKVSQVLDHARESLKLLEILEKEALAKARTFVRNPMRLDRKRITNERVLASLRALGVAGRSEFEELQRKVDHLQLELTSLHGMLAAAGAEAVRRRPKQKQPPRRVRPSSRAAAIPNT